MSRFKGINIKCMKESGVVLNFGGEIKKVIIEFGGWRGCEW
jgi:hypothetical protein